VSFDGFDHLGVDAQHRVQRHHRILEDHRDAVATQPAHRIVRFVEQILAVEQHAARYDAPGRIDQPENRKARDRLARARFADESQHLACVDREAHVVDRFHHAGFGEEMRPEIFDGEHRHGDQPTFPQSRIRKY
jgi:hypothetical protein